MSARHGFHARLTAADSLLVGFQVIGFDWRYLYVNPAAAAQGHLTVAELTGHRMMDVYPDIENSAMFRLLERCMNDRVSEEFDNLFTYPDGESRWFDVRIEPAHEGIHVYSVDIHERKLWQVEVERQAGSIGLSPSMKERWRSFIGSSVPES